MRRTLAATLAGLTLLAGAVTFAVDSTPAPAATTTTPTGTTGPTGPSAAGPVIASLDERVPIAAGGSWVVWSVPVSGGYGLEGSHGGVTRALNVAPRPQPFDVNIGTSATGTPVVTFSRCTKTPALPPYGLLAIDPLSGAGCRIHAVNLRTQRETTPAIPHPPGTSDTTGSMWHGRVAFARMDPAHHQQVQQVLLWTPGQRALRTLPHGGVPTDCPFRSCAGIPRSGSVEGLSYDGRLVSFLWAVQAAGVIGHGGWEVRADTVASGRSTLISSGFAGEACTGSEDLVEPSPPILDGSTVSLVTLEADCYAFKSVFGQLTTTAGGNGSYADLPGIVLGLAGDAGALYAVEAPTPADETDPTCTAAAPCQIQRIPRPAPLRPEPRKPSSPFF